jgi:ribosomal protein L18E
MNAEGRVACVVLQILGDGELKLSLKVHATQFSASARTKIEAAGGTIVDVAPKIKWTRALGKERKAAAEAAPKPTKTVE